VPYACLIPSVVVPRDDDGGHLFFKFSAEGLDGVIRNLIRDFYLKVEDYVVLSLFNEVLLAKYNPQLQVNALSGPSCRALLKKKKRLSYS
jgi:translation initiation factor IF-2